MKALDTGANATRRRRRTAGQLHSLKAFPAMLMRMDKRIAAQADASDVSLDALENAYNRLPKYLPPIAIALL